MTCCVHCRLQWDQRNPRSTVVCTNHTNVSLYIGSLKAYGGDQGQLSGAFTEVMSNVDLG